jgi:exodeoxyribonuclease VIII|tara:strand:+ start:31076 stop:31885 length:810 start_codon:yes stop_codon:yes gene_type:complete
MNNERYHARTELSNSMMTKLLKSPAHLRYYLDNDQEPTPAMILGTQVHTMLLEPGDADFVKAPKDRRTKEGKAQYAELLETYPASSIIKSDTYDQIEGMVDSVLANASASSLLRSAQADGHIEESVFYTDPITQVSCKARIDAVPGKSSCLYKDCLVDFKTTIDASPEAFAKSVFNFGYHRQAAHYLSCWNNTHPDDPRETFIIIACEKTPPYAVAVYELDNGSVEMGAYEVARLKELYAECVATDTWDAYGNTVHTLELPSWATPRIG